MEIFFCLVPHFTQQACALQPLKFGFCHHETDKIKGSNLQLANVFKKKIFLLNSLLFSSDHFLYFEMLLFFGYYISFSLFYLCLFFQFSLALLIASPGLLFCQVRSSGDWPVSTQSPGQSLFKGLSVTTALTPLKFLNTVYLLSTFYMTVIF